MVKSEQKILLLIKLFPPLFTLLTALVITLFIYLEHQNNFNNNIETFKTTFFDTNKEFVKKEVQTVHTYITHQKNNSEKRLKIKLKEHINNAYAYIDSLYKNNKNLSKKELLNIIKKSLGNLRFFEGRGYFYINTMQGENILHPLRPELEGTSLYNFKDIKGNSVVIDSIKSLRALKEGYYTWYWYKDKTSEIQYKKIGFQKHFEPLDIYIGIGEYLVDYENELKNEIFEYTKTITFPNNGFIFIIDYEGKILSNPNKSLIGKNVYNTIDNNGNFFVKDMISISKKQKEGFIKYFAPTTSTDSMHPKTSYIKAFEDWNFFIGSGFYHAELNKQLDKKRESLSRLHNSQIKKVLFISLLVTSLLLIISMYVSKLIENKFLKYKEKIAHQISENSQKDQMLAQQSKMAAMGEMIQNIAHQWRQPLSAITTTASGVELKLNTKGIEKEELISYMKNIIRYSNHLSNTIDDFKDFFNPHQNKTSFSIKNIFEKSIKLIQSQFNSKNIIIRSSIEDANLFALENELIQVILNLLNNSKDAFEEKDIKNKYIFINSKTIEETVYITIYDNAGGIDEAIINRIFEPYFTTKHKSQGTGIGLYMSEEIIKKHLDGTISVYNKVFEYENNKFKGACFTIVLPLINDKK